MNQKVSILLAVHNDQNNIGRAISSILNQKFENFELLLMDEGIMAWSFFVWVFVEFWTISPKQNRANYVRD